MLENKYFKIADFKCRCGKCDLPDGMPTDELVRTLVEIREHYDAPITIKSGYRCPTHNKAVGGASKSRHTHGDAVDFVVKGVATKEVFKHVLQTYNNKPYGIALSINKNDEYRGFIHLDTRGYKARWSYNKDGEIYFAELKKELNLV